jgi:hypothetical protein
MNKNPVIDRNRGDWSNAGVRELTEDQTALVSGGRAELIATSPFGSVPSGAVYQSWIGGWWNAPKDPRLG